MPARPRANVVVCPSSTATAGAISVQHKGSIFRTLVSTDAQTTVKGSDIHAAASSATAEMQTACVVVCSQEGPAEAPSSSRSRSVHLLALKAAGNIGAGSQSRPRTLVTQQEELEPRKSHPADGPARCIVCGVATWPVQASIWARRKPTAAHRATAVAQGAGLKALLKLLLGAARGTVGRKVIPARDLEDQLGRARLAILDPRVSLRVGLLVMRSAEEEDRHRRRQLSWERHAEFSAIVRADCDAALECWVSQCRELRAAAAQGIAHDRASGHIEAIVQRRTSAGVLRLQRLARIEQRPAAHGR
mmetsp:Transcript_26430/g.88055  ORF Transcript_26430/g.88055 Transcript_26430/m.88055 type:complete len:304 (-) Transcript_26430:289-1200(-)